MTNEPGRAAACPICGFVVGFVNEDNHLVIWHYPEGNIVVRHGVLICSCGCVIKWGESRPLSSVLDKGASLMIQ